MSSPKSSTSTGLLALAALLLSALPAHADSYPSTLPPSPQPRYSGLRVLYLDEHGGGLYLGDGELRLEGFYRGGTTGLAVDVQWQYMSGFTPAVMEGRSAWQPGLATHDLSFGLGWRLGGETWQVTPELNLRGLFASGVGGDSLWGVSPGVICEYIMFPETTTIQLHYQETLPFAHSGNNNGPDLVPVLMPLAAVDLRMSYRVVRPLEISVGFEVRQMPSDLGRGRLFTSNSAWLRGFYIGSGILF